MGDLAELTRWHDRLTEARFSGVRRVRDATGEEVEYRSERELSLAMAEVERRIAKLSGQARPKVIVFRTSKGL